MLLWKHLQQIPRFLDRKFDYLGWNCDACKILCRSCRQNVTSYHEVPKCTFRRKLYAFQRWFSTILPVLARGSREMIVFLSYKSSPLFADLQVLKLSENMRLKSMKHDKNVDKDVLLYPDYWLRVGEGKINTKLNSEISLPPSVKLLIHQQISWILCYVT